MQYLTCNIQATVDLGIKFTCVRTSCLTIEQQQLYNNTMELRGYEVLLLKGQLFLRKVIGLESSFRQNLFYNSEMDPATRGASTLPLC